MYMALKHTHLLLVALSLSLLVLRFILSLKGSTLLQRKFLKIAPHVVDTLLLLSAVGLMITINQYPFVTPWLTEKFIGILAYIALGVMALKGRTLALRVFAFVGALGWLVLVVKVAITKTPVLFG
ncbi:MAG: SirB2 family protein [Gammaproteobacteria bacterium]|nr:SirB2 family protein [Gammaproteobacteria bacterium]